MEHQHIIFRFVRATVFLSHALLAVSETIRDTRSELREWKQIGRIDNLAFEQRAIFIIRRDDTSDDSSSQGSHEPPKVFERYFPAFAILGFVIIAAAIYIEHIRRRRTKQRHRVRRQNALAQDTGGWSASRRWYFGNWGSHHESIIGRRDGLDERGEAPPPYRGNQIAHSVPRYEAPAYEEGLSHEMQPPPVAITRERSFYKPPDYEETVRSVTLTSSGSSPVTPMAHPQSPH